MKQKENQVLRWKDGNEVPDRMEGHIIVFDDPLIVEELERFEEEVKEGEHKGFIRHWSKPTGRKAKCFFMRAEGGFGCVKVCSGRMIIGEFYESLQDVLDNKPFENGNTKCFPDGYIPDLFKED